MRPVSDLFLTVWTTQMCLWMRLRPLKCNTYLIFSNVTRVWTAASHSSHLHVIIDGAMNSALLKDWTSRLCRPVLSAPLCESYWGSRTQTPRSTSRGPFKMLKNSHKVNTGHFICCFRTKPRPWMWKLMRKRPWALLPPVAAGSKM